MFEALLKFRLCLRRRRPLSLSSLVRALPHSCINIFVAPFIASFRSAPSSSSTQRWNLLFSSTDNSSLPYPASPCWQTWFVLIKAAQKCIFTALFLLLVRLRHVMMSCPRFEGHSFNLGPEKTYIFRRCLLWRSHLLSEPKDLARSEGRRIDFGTYRS